MADPLEKLRERVARQGEHSHVDAEAREHIRAIIEAAVRTTFEPGAWSRLAKLLER